MHILHAIVDRVAIGRRLLDTAFALLAIAGILKLGSLDSFILSLRTWTVVPSSLRGLVGVVLPIAEITLASMHFLRLSSRTTAWLGLAFFVMVTCAYVLQWTMLSRPECKCFGDLLAFELAISESRYILIRNFL